MAKASVAAGEGKVSTSKLVRAWLKDHGGATVPEIIEAFKAQGITVSKSLASKIKYTKKPKRGRKANTVKAPSGAKKGAKPARGEKAAAIRAVWHEKGRKARPRDVIAELSSTGMNVTSSEVIGVRDRMFKRRSKASAGVAVAAAAPSPPAGELTLERLLAAKAVAKKLGGIEAAYQSFLALSKLEGL